MTCWGSLVKFAVRVFVGGWNPTQLHGDFDKPWNKHPYKSISIIECHTDFECCSSQTVKALLFIYVTVLIFVRELVYWNNIQYQSTTDIQSVKSLYHSVFLKIWEWHNVWMFDTSTTLLQEFSWLAWISVKECERSSRLPFHVCSLPWSYALWFLIGAWSSLFEWLRREFIFHQAFHRRPDGHFGRWCGCGRSQVLRNRQN